MTIRIEQDLDTTRRARAAIQALNEAMALCAEEGVQVLASHPDGGMVEVYDGMDDADPVEAHAIDGRVVAVFCITGDFV